MGTYDKPSGPGLEQAQGDARINLGCCFTAELPLQDRRPLGVQPTLHTIRWEGPPTAFAPAQRTLRSLPSEQPFSLSVCSPAPSLPLLPHRLRNKLGRRSQEGN